MSLTLDGTIGISTTGNILSNGGNIVATGGIISASGNIYAGNIIASFSPSSLVVSGNINGANIIASGVITGTVSTAGNITGGNVIATTLIVSGTETDTGNITGGNILTGGVMSAASTVTGGSILTAGTLTVNSSNGTTAIVNGGSNGTGNIGSSTTYFNTVFAKATSAQYADLAEMYMADTKLDEGIVVEFGGNKEVCATRSDHSTKVAGVVSTNPSYIMNAGCQGITAVPVALTGRVPCYVIGTIAKGDRLVASKHIGVATVLDMDKYQPGCIIGKALEDYDSQEIGKIEIAVGIR